MPTLQIVVGTYEKVLHGLTASIKESDHPSIDDQHDVHFADTFLFQAHGSAIRSLAISPVSSSNGAAEKQKVLLASGGSDERINLYHLSASSPQPWEDVLSSTPSLANKDFRENPRNRELGTLLHHSSSVNALYFPTRSKLLSAADDNTIAVTRTRDWTVLSSIKAPIPKAYGRPSGDTAPLGGYPAGVNDFAVHPSMKLMVSVGKGEKCMRLWNLVTGRKAGVLNFEKELLEGIGEGRWGSGEGRKVEWNSVGEEFVVAFERGAVLFGLDSKPKARILPDPPTKIQQVHYTDVTNGQGNRSEILAVSTENGRILFYSTASIAGTETRDRSAQPSVSSLPAIGQLDSAAYGQTNRIKDFEVLSIPNTQGPGTRSLLVSGSSDGTVSVWMLAQNFVPTDDQRIKESSDFKSPHPLRLNGIQGKEQERSPGQTTTASVGQILGTYSIGNRITCLKAFVMSELVSKGQCETAKATVEA